MGITVHYELRVSDDAASRVPSIVHAIAESARGLGFTKVGETIHLEGVACDSERCDDPALSWLLIQAKRRVGESSEVPLELYAIRTLPGEGCEPANIGLARFLDGTWQWSSFCKTQRAADRELGGVPHFVTCHTRLCKWLRSIESLGVDVQVQDEGGYWGTWNAGVLAKALAMADVGTALLGGTLPELIASTSRRRSASARAIEPTPQTSTATERYRHSKWGDATLLARNGDKVRLRFDDGSERTLLLASVTAIP